METYNGYANYETWNVALWISNDEVIYNLVKRYSNWERAKKTLWEFYFTATDDGVSFEDPALNTEELDELMSELS